MVVDYRSVSQVTEYEKCPQAYYLSRIERVWRRPAAWLPHGTAYHCAIEQYELSKRTLSLEKVKETYRDKYIAEVNKLCKKTPNFEYWAKSGRYGGKEDVQRRLLIGQEMIEKYFKYVEENPNEIPWLTPDNTPAIELEFFEDFDGVMMKGFIDQITQWSKTEGLSIVWESGAPVKVRDLKTGQRPGDTFQLKVYAIALRKRYGVEVTEGDYWMGKLGGPTKPYDLTEMSDDEVYDRIHAADEGIKSGRFNPKPSTENCRRCDVRTSCPFSM